MRKFKFLLAPIAAAVLAACAVGPNYHAPETQAAEKFDNVEATYSTREGDGAVLADLRRPDARQARRPRRWRRTTTCASRSSRVDEARALRRDAAFDLAPTINASGGYTKTRTSTQGSAARRAAQHRALRRRLRRVLGTRLLRRRPPRRSKPATPSSAPRKPACATRRSSSRPKSRAPTSSCAASSSSSTSRAATSRTSNRRSTSRRPGSMPAAARSSTPRARRRSSPPRSAPSRRSKRPWRARSIGSRCSSGREPGALRAELTPHAEPAAAAGHRARGRSGRPAAPPAGYPRRRTRARRRHGAHRRRGRRPVPARHLHGQRGLCGRLFGRLGDSGTDAYVLAPGISWAHLRLRPRAGAHRRRQVAQGRRAAAV